MKAILLKEGLMKAKILIMLISLAIATSSFAKEKVEFESALKDTSYHPPVWILKFENGATLWVARDPSMEKGLSEVWWIGKEYHVKYKSFYGYIVKLVEEKNKNK